MQVTVPAGVLVGQQFTVQVGVGSAEKYTITVPPGSGPLSTLQIQLPAKAGPAPHQQSHPPVAQPQQQRRPQQPPLSDAQRMQQALQRAGRAMHKASSAASPAAAAGSGSRSASASASASSSSATPAAKEIKLGDLLIGPGRRTRPPRLCFILRGLPGSGKTHLAKLIKRLESADGDEAAAAAAAEAGARRSGGGKTGTRIHALDDYFMAEVEREGVTTMEFEHDPAMEAVYVKREREWEGGAGEGDIR